MASAAAAKKWPRPSQRTAVAPSDQPEVRLVDQGGGLEGVVGRFGGHARGGEPPQLVVDEREQVSGGPAVTGGRGVQKSGQIGHRNECTRRRRRQHWEPAAAPPSNLSPDVYACFIVRFVKRPQAAEVRDDRTPGSTGITCQGCVNPLHCTAAVRVGPSNSGPGPLRRPAQPAGSGGGRSACSTTSSTRSSPRTAVIRSRPGRGSRLRDVARPAWRPGRSPIGMIRSRP